MTPARVAILVLCILGSSGCAWHYPPASGRYTPESPAPNAARIAELAQDGVRPPASTPWLRLSSAFVNAGGGVRLSCFVPRDTPNLRGLQLGLVDGAGSVGKAGTEEVHTRERLIESVPCGDYVAVCNAIGPSGRVLIHQEQPFTSRGACNAAGDDR